MPAARNSGLFYFRLFDGSCNAELLFSVYFDTVKQKIAIFIQNPQW
jgi:hypothetical protein